MADLLSLKQRFDRARLLALAQQEGLRAKGGKIQCPKRCSDAADSCSVFERDGTAGWKCHRCDAGGDVFTLVACTRGLADFKDQLRAVEDLAGVAPAPQRKRGPPPPPPIAELWESTASDDPQVRSYLASRGLEAALDRGLCRCSVGRAGWYWLDKRANEDYRLAVALRGTDGRLVSLAVRVVSPLADPKAKRMLNCLGIPSADTALGDVAGAQAAARAYLCEGIADTLALQLAGVAAVGAPGVDAVSSLPHFLGDVRGREVVLCPQNDVDGSKAGRARRSSGPPRPRACAPPAPRCCCSRRPPSTRTRPTGSRRSASRPSPRRCASCPARTSSTWPSPPDTPAPATSGSGALQTDPELAQVIPLPRRFPLTDTGNAERLLAMHGEDLRYCHDWKEWLVWDGARWQRDNTSAVLQRTKSVARAMRAEFEQEKNRRLKNPLAQKPDEYLSALRSHAQKAESSERRRAMVSMASVEASVSRWRSSSTPRRSSSTSRTASSTCATASCGRTTARRCTPAWCRSPGTRRPPARAGSSSSGDLPRQRGADLLRAPRRGLLAQRAHQRAGLLLLLRHRGERQDRLPLHPARAARRVRDRGGLRDVHLARLGAGRAAAGPRAPARRAPRHRLEPDKNAHFSESLLKLITGEDPIVARTLNEKEQQFLPVLKLWLLANHQPRVSDASHGFWRRVKLIPFDYLVPPEKKDPQLVAKLRAELPGILRWAVEGCRQWQSEGLGTPAAVSEATQEYRSDMDVIGRFLEEACETTPGDSTPVSELYEAYKKWAANSEIAQCSKDAFSKKLKSRGVRSDRTKTGRFFKGIRPIAGKPTQQELVTGDSK
jgi:hypothetical protein